MATSQEYLKSQASKYRFEIVLMSLSILTAIISLIIFITNYNTNLTQSNYLETDTAGLPSSSTILVDLSGAVEKPDVYEVTSGARLKDVLALSNGLSIYADYNYFTRNFNLARFVNDQEKIYIPSYWETSSGIITETQKILDYSKPVQLLTQNDIQINNNQIKINVNTASSDELDQLPLVGQATAQKIIQSRPYTSIVDLINRKVIKQNVYDQIKDLVEVN